MIGASDAVSSTMDEPVNWVEKVDIHRLPPMAQRRNLLSLAFFLLVPVCPTSLLGDETRTAPIQFQQQIRPILAEHCYACHGFDAESRQAELRLDTATGPFGPGGEAGVIVPGAPERSLFWERITSDDESLVMPPPETKNPLSDEQKELLRAWIKQGATYEEHWSFQPPTKYPLPDIHQTDWPRQPIDYFVLARLEQESLTPSPEADRPTLIRRVAFALTGLPPTLDEQARYIKDESPHAYETMVDHYLAKPQFGEEMARHWLDVARYADTHGLHLDNQRLMWAYRDWVVRALNQNLPYDQFTIWQLAGDLLPNPTPDQQVATGFNRCNVTTSEGGSIPEEFLFRYAVDRASTAVQAWMGLTAGCAVCHDHKYDPLTTREFYSLYAFFYSAADPAMDRNAHNTEPTLALPTRTQSEQLASATRAEAESLQEIEAAIRAFTYEDPAVRPASEEQTNGTSDHVWFRDTLWDEFFPAGATTRNTTRNPSVWEANPAFGTPSGYRVLRQANSYFHEDIYQPVLQPLTVPDNALFQFFVRVAPRDIPQAIAIVLNGSGGTRRIRWGSDSHLDGSVNEREKTIRKGPLPTPGIWTQLGFTGDELGLKPGQTITSISLQVAGGVVWWDTPTLSGYRSPALDPAASFKVWWDALRSKSPPDFPAHLTTLLATAPDQEVTAEQRRELLEFYLTHVARPINNDIRRLRRRWELARSRSLAIADSIPETLVFRNLESTRDAFVMLRGEYDRPGEKVEPAVPEVLPPLPNETVSNGLRPTRLDLARWLVTPEHPLTARVATNRFWQQIWGRGLVTTSDDFGAQGTPPTHPKLLDWLAVEFRERDWDVKQLVRMLVTSATFRQASQLNKDLLSRDPGNQLYARGPRFRLDAEQIRDNALAVSGLIQLDLGGPGVKTYQPPDIWEPVGYGDSNTRYYLRDHGAALFRRSLYTFLKRTAPPPFMSNFDAPNREQSCVVRERSNTPLQALQLMNDVQHFEAARGLAERILETPNVPDQLRVEHLYRIVLARPPHKKEQQMVLQLLETQRMLYDADPEAARDAVHVGDTPPRDLTSEPELAAWTLVVNLILNLDETVTRN
jgi:hypothetical protein